MILKKDIFDFRFAVNDLLPSPDLRENPFWFFFKNKKIWKESGNMDSEKAQAFRS